MSFQNHHPHFVYSWFKFRRKVWGWFLGSISAQLAKRSQKKIFIRDFFVGPNWHFIVTKELISAVWGEISDQSHEEVAQIVILLCWTFKSPTGQFSWNKFFHVVRLWLVVYFTCGWDSPYNWFLSEAIFSFFLRCSTQDAKNYFRITSPCLLYWQLALLKDVIVLPT